MRTIVVHRHREHAERIVLPQVFLGRERKSARSAKCLQIGRMHARRVELLPVVRHVIVGARQRAAQAHELQRAQFVDACLFDWLELIAAGHGRSSGRAECPGCADAKVNARSRRYSRGAASLHTSTHSAPVSCAMRSGEIRSALLREPAAGTTSSNAFSDTSQ